MTATADGEKAATAAAATKTTTATGGRDGHRKAGGAGMDTGGRGRQESMNGSTGKAGSKQERTCRRGQEGPKVGSKAVRLVEERCALFSQCNPKMLSEVYPSVVLVNLCCLASTILI